MTYQVDFSTRPFVVHRESPGSSRKPNRAGKSSKGIPNGNGGVRSNCFFAGEFHPKKEDEVRLRICLPEHAEGFFVS
jgi:hypothetical protein